MYEIFLLIIIFIIISRYDLKYIILLLIVIFSLLKYYKQYDKNESNFPYNISYILNRLEKYKNINDIEYKFGMKYFSSFMDVIKKINNNKYDNLNDKYDSAEEYLHLSIKHFNSLTLSSDNSNLKTDIELLHKEGLILLKNTSKKLNDQWGKTPNTTKKQIIFDLPKPHNSSFIYKK
jgi:hypothetical protein